MYPKLEQSAKFRFINHEEKKEYECICKWLIFYKALSYFAVRVEVKMEVCFT